MFRESPSSTFWFQPVWGLHAFGQQVVIISHHVGVLVSAEQLKGMHQIVIHIPSGGTVTLSCPDH